MLKRRLKSNLRSQRGFSLIELMVAMVIGLIIVLGAGQLFIMTLQSFRQAEQVSERLDSLAFFSDSVGLDIRTSSSAENPGGDNSRLVLGYEPPRNEDFYCSSTSPSGNLESVEYAFSGGVVSIWINCDGVTSSSGEPLISDLQGASFDATSDLFVRINVNFNPVTGEATDADTKEFSFIVARRNLILDTF